MLTTGNATKKSWKINEKITEIFLFDQIMSFSRENWRRCGVVETNSYRKLK